MAADDRKKKGLKIMNKIQDSSGARTFISIVIGLGIASLFRLTCRGEGCIIVQGPPLDQTKMNVYKIDDQCYKYKAVPTMCKPVDTS